MVIGSLSPRITTLYQTLTLRPARTDPTIVALCAIQLPSPKLGRRSPRA